MIFFDIGIVAQCGEKRIKDAKIFVYANHNPNSEMYETDENGIALIKIMKDNYYNIEVRHPDFETCLLQNIVLEYPWSILANLKTNSNNPTQQ